MKQVVHKGYETSILRNFFIKFDISFEGRSTTVKHWTKSLQRFISTYILLWLCELLCYSVLKYKKS